MQISFQVLELTQIMANNKIPSIDARNELAELVKRKVEIAVSKFGIKINISVKKLFLFHKKNLKLLYALSK